MTSTRQEEEASTASTNPRESACLEAPPRKGRVPHTLEGCSRPQKQSGPTQHSLEEVGADAPSTHGEPAWLGAPSRTPCRHWGLLSSVGPRSRPPITGRSLPRRDCFPNCKRLGQDRQTHAGLSKPGCTLANPSPTAPPVPSQAVSEQAAGIQVPLLTPSYPDISQLTRARVWGSRAKPPFKALPTSGEMRGTEHSQQLPGLWAGQHLSWRRRPGDSFPHLRPHLRASTRSGTHTRASALATALFISAHMEGEALLITWVFGCFGLEGAPGTRKDTVTPSSPREGSSLHLIAINALWGPPTRQGSGPRALLLKEEPERDEGRNTGDGAVSFKQISATPRAAMARARPRPTSPTHICLCKALLPPLSSFTLRTTQGLEKRHYH